MRRRLSILLFVIVSCLPARAQFYISGAENPGVSWNTMESDNFRIVYPDYCDSLAREYLICLEGYRDALGTSCGFVPNQFYKNRMPVILHAASSISNGLVSWAPRRMELYANPEAYSPDPYPWIDQLAVHESRHAAQMQLSRVNGFHRTLGILTGEMWTGAVAALYPGQALLEGDAVVAETALTNSGRGRTADFLEYYRVAFADSLYRNWWQWRWGSQKRYTPTYYAAGYLLISGMRTTFDSPSFYADYNRRVEQKSLPLFNLQKTVRAASGKKMAEAWDGIQRDFAAQWAEEERLRGPFVEGETITRKARYYDSYNSLVFAGDELLALHSGLDVARELVRINEDGSHESIGAFASGTSRLVWDTSDQRLIWTEYQPSKLYPMESYSRLCYLSDWGSHRKYAAKGHLYNPAAAKEFSAIAVVQYYEDGNRSVVLLSSRKGIPFEEYVAPAGIQPVEPVWTGRDLYVSGVSSEGFSIYRLPEWEPLFAPAHSKINHVFSTDGLIWFTSDRNGVNNLHSVDPATGELLQRTSTRFGGNDFAFSPEGELYYSAPTADGRVIRRIAADSLLNIPVTFGDYPSPIADRLSAQESLKPSPYTGEISAPKPYRKAAHPTKLHSWAPVYVDYSLIDRESMEEVSSASSLGATAFLQNELGSSYGLVGVSLTGVPDSLSAGQWFRPSLHAQYIWTGLGPTLEFRADVGERVRHRQYFTRVSEEEGMKFPSTTEKLDGTFMSFTSAISFPFNLGGGGWSRGVIPYFRASWNNDIMGTVDVEHFTNTVVFNLNEHSGVLQSKAGIRAYSMRPIPSSCIYPRLGMGVDLGWTDSYSLRSTWPGYSYAKLYGYLPGLTRTHGLRLETDFRHGRQSDWVNSDEIDLLADYAFPFLPLDLGAGSLFYLRNFEARIHGRYSYGHYDSYVTRLNETRNVFKAGATVQARLASLLCIPFDFHIGARYMYDFSKGDGVWDLALNFDF